jgi:quinol monooxygenase YgiN
MVKPFLDFVKRPSEAVRQLPPATRSGILGLARNGRLGRGRHGEVPMLHILVTMMVKEGRMEDFLAVCAELQPSVLKEPGCRAYDYTREIPSPLGTQEPIDPNRITLLERWESLDALKAHMETPHMKQAGLKMKDLRTSVTVRVVESIF